MRKWMSILLAIALMALTACGSGEQNTPLPEDPRPPVAEPPAQSAPEQVQPPAEKPPVPSEPEPTPPEEESVQESRPIQIVKGSERIGRQDEDGNELCSVEWDTLALQDEHAYPRLAARLEALAAERADYGAEFIADMLPFAKEQLESFPESFGGFTSQQVCSVRRVDSRILSIQCDWYEYTGGAHPNYGVSGLNFAPETGQTLTLTDILADAQPVYAILAERLQDTYHDVFFSSLDGLLAEYTPDQFQWTLSDRDITFYFSPYDIAPYAVGLLTVTIGFDEMPELFRAEYTAASVDP